MDDINEIFEESDEITEVPLDKVEATSKVESKGSSLDMAQDYNFVREKLIQSIVRGSELIDEATKEAKSGPTPRAVEAASGAVKTLTDVSNSLIGLHEKIRQIERERYNNNENDLDTDGTIKDDAGTILKSTLSDLLEKIDLEEKK